MKSEKRVIPYWEKGAEWKEGSFYIKRLESKLPIEATEIPRTTLPRFTFLFMLEGEVLADISGQSYLCRGGQFLMIPDNTPFAVHHFRNLVGYTGSFSLSFLKDSSYPCLTSGKPVFHTFWFDEAAFVAEIMDRISAASARGDDGYIHRAFDLILYGLRTPAKEKAHPMVSRFMEMLFDRQQVTDTVSGYANRLGISPSYLNKLVRTQTRHSAMDWVEIARVNWAKNLLRSSSLSVTEVSKAVGIDDASYFTRFFRKVTGLTPSEFRKREAVKLEWL
ncbi:MAG: helix-turn-helix domain-containing protein [Bacteroidales bacterium]|nr:helix-turn-helix domain-containing protein [Bacteroidales bacterium]